MRERGKPRIGLKGLTRSMVRSESAVIWGRLRPGGTLPVLAEAVAPGVDIVDWARRDRHRIEATMLDSGAILFRGFDVTIPEALQRFASVFVDEFYRDNGEHPRAAVDRGVYTGVMYVRNYGDGLGLDWRDVFQTADRDVVAEICRRDGLEFEWRRDRLRTRCIRPAVIRHPRTGQWSWFNQARHFNGAAETSSWWTTCWSHTAEIRSAPNVNCWSPWAM